MDPDEIGLANLVAESQGIEIPTPEPETPAAEEVTEPAPKAEEPKTEDPAPEPAPAEEPSEPSQEEGSPEPKTETPERKPVDWTQFLPPAPQIPAPEPDENGQIDHQTYTEYVIAQAEANLEYKNKVNEFKTVHNQQLDEAEKILPDIKTNPKTRAIVENHRIAQAINGQSGDIVTAAQDIKDMLAEAEARGAKNAKASVEIQQNVAVETGAATPPPSAEEEKGQELAKRINAGDDEAVVELLSLWDEKGII